MPIFYISIMNVKIFSRLLSLIFLYTLTSPFVDKRLLMANEAYQEDSGSSRPFKGHSRIGLGLYYWDDNFSTDNGNKSTDDFFSQEDSPILYYNFGISLSNFWGLSIGLNYRTNQFKHFNPVSMEGFTSYNDLDQQRTGDKFLTPEFNQMSAYISYRLKPVRIFFSFNNSLIRKNWKTKGIWDGTNNLYQGITFIPAGIEGASPASGSLLLNNRENIAWHNQEQDWSIGVRFQMAELSVTRHKSITPFFVKLSQEDGKVYEIFSEGEFTGFSVKLALSSQIHLKEDWFMVLRIPASIGEINLNNQFIEGKGGNYFAYGISLSLRNNIVRQRELSVDIRFGFVLEQSELNFGEKGNYLETKKDFIYDIPGNQNLPKGSRVNLHLKRETQNYRPFFSVSSSF